MSSVTIDEIRRQEDELFDAECPNLAGGMQAKTKALQQLAVSEDSPFNLTSSVRPQLQQQLSRSSIVDREQIKLRDEKARLLREETEEIKKQLDLVKSHLNEFNLIGTNQARSDRLEESDCSCSRQQQCHRFSCNTNVQCIHSHKCDQQCQTECSNQDATNQAQPQPINSPPGAKKLQEENHVTNQQQTSADSQFYHVAASKSPDGSTSSARNCTQVNQTKFRPLTGQTDCPNCVCDRRRSVCDKCIIMQKNVVHQQSSDQKQLAISELQPSGDFNRQPSLLTEQKITRLNSKLQQDISAIDNLKTDKRRENHDERPIRPAKKNLEELLRDERVVEAIPVASKREVDQVVVPNSIYTIGKSLNEKRTKLAQAIEELQVMTEKVRKRGDRLEQERQLAKLYRDQWKFGPTIGGAKSASGESLKASYQSRLDPNLARDTKSMMGFPHVESALKLRQYDKFGGSQSNLAHPKPMPRLSKLAANSRAALLTTKGNYRRPTQASALHSRSKSLEFIPRQNSRSVETPARQQALGTNKSSKTATKQLTIGPQQHDRPKALDTAGLSRAKSSFSANPSPSKPPPKTDEASLESQPGEAVEEDLEEEIREDELESLQSDNVQQGDHLADGDHRCDRSHGKGAKESSRPSQTETASKTDARVQENSPTDQRSDQRGWIPVFGETEIKTVNRRAPERKVIVINGSTGETMSRQQLGMQRQATNINQAIGTRSILRTGTNVATRQLTRPAVSTGVKTRFGTGNDCVLNEARKQLHFATDLLERDHIDSRTKNQLIVKRKQSTNAGPAQPLKFKPARMMTVNNSNERTAPTQRQTSAGTDTIHSEESTATTDTAQRSISSANKEISRLESMISEQQKLLLKLTSSGDQKLDLRMSSACSSCRRASPGSCCGRAHQTGRQLISQLRDRLNKTKTRLARTLEEERAKHQRLEQRFDSSLRKQSDLEAENELLKRSLSKCIDTCLKDIRNTFESLSEQLNESARGIEADGRQASPSPIAVPDRIRTSGPSRVSLAADDAETPLLANAAQLIADNSHLKRMKLHIDTIEEQRRGIFDELKQERARSQQLELELQQSKLELDQLLEAKRHLEMQLETNRTNPAERTNESSKAKSDMGPEPGRGTDAQADHSAAQHTSSTQKTPQAFEIECNETDSSQCPQQLMSENSDDPSSMTFSSIDMYRQFIQSMTPDFDSIRRERRMILNEFDSIKRMLSDMEI